jgi:hypothetical protein
MTLHLIFAVAAIVCFGLAAAGVPSRVGLRLSASRSSLSRWC